MVDLRFGRSFSARGSHLDSVGKSADMKQFYLTHSKWIAYLLIALALLAFVGYFLVYHIYAFALFRFPFDYDQGEGFELVDTILFSRGHWPYQSNNFYPFYSSNYPPVFHLILVPFFWLLGPSYWIGRFMGYLGTLITAAVIGYAVQRETRRWWLAMIAGLAYLASNYIYHVGPLFRQHLFMVMLEIIAVVLAARVMEREERENRLDWRGWLGVMVVLLLAGYTKQLAYSTVATIFFFWFLRDVWRPMRWAIGFASVTLLIFGLLNWATNGEWYIATVTANINQFVSGQAVGLTKQWWHLHLILIVTSLGYLLYQLYRERLSIYSIWFLFSALNGIATVGKWGAGESYFATAIAASCICMGLGFGRILQATQHRPYAYQTIMLIIPLLLLNQAERVFHLPTHTPTLQAVARLLNKPTVTYDAPRTGCFAQRPRQIIPYVDHVWGTQLGRPPSLEDIRAGEKIVSLIAEGNTPAFSEEAAFNLALGRDVVTNPTQLLNLYNNNKVDLTQMLEMLENEKFDTVILRAQLYPPPVLDTIGANYYVTDWIQMNGFVYCIFRPNPS